MFSIRGWQIMSYVHWSALLFVSMEMSKRWVLLQRYLLSHCFVGECTQGCSLSSAKPSSWRPPRPQVDASCLSISMSACEHLPVASIRGSREGSCIQITFNFIRMNSWHSQERAAELCDAAAAWRGWAPWAPEVLLCNWSRTHDSFFHCYQRHISSGGNTSGYFLLAQFAWIRWNDGCDSSNVGSNRGILLVLKYLHW